MEFKASITKLARTEVPVYRLNFYKSTKGINKPLYISMEDGLVSKISVRRPSTCSFMGTAQLKNRIIPETVMHELLNAWNFDSDRGYPRGIRPQNAIYLTTYLLELEDKKFKNV